MKKKGILLIVIILIVLVSLGIGKYLNNNKLKLTEDERNFINNNFNTEFHMGYYNTFSESLFTDKLCEKIEADTGLKIRPYQDSWHNNVTMLKEGELPILINMNMTEERKEFILFTSELSSLSAGIYSNQFNKIDAYKEIEGKVLASEKGVVLSANLKSNYPNLNFELKEYDTLDSVRAALNAGHVDGFISTRTFDSGFKGLYYFEIPSLSKGNNFIGVHKDYLLLHSILEKEVAYLNEIDWGETVSDIINFELEKSSLDYLSAEKDYLNQTESLSVGIPSEYFLYMYGEDYNPKGIFAEVLEKISFILDINFIYTFDSLENLRLRNDIDFYIDYRDTRSYVSSPIIEDEAVIIGGIERNNIKEIYDLSTYKVGVLGVVEGKNNLLSLMPNMQVIEYNNLKELKEDIDFGRIDYLIAPKIYLPQIKSTQDLTIKGLYQTEPSHFVSDNQQLIRVINKSLAIIDVNKIIKFETTKESNSNDMWLYLFFTLLMSMFLLVLKRVFIKWKEMYYKNNDYGLYNKTYLINKSGLEDKTLILIGINNRLSLIQHFGDKVYQKYIIKFLSDIQKELTATEEVIYIDQEKFLIIKESRVESFCALIEQKKDYLINKALIPTNLNIAYTLHHQGSEVKEILRQLEVGLLIAREKNKVINIDSKEQRLFSNKLAKDYEVMNLIYGGQIDHLFKKVIDKEHHLVARYISVEIAGRSYESISKIASKFNLINQLDKRIMTSMMSKKIDEDLFIEISGLTLVSADFMHWMNKKLDTSLKIFLLVDMEVYESNEDLLMTYPNIIPVIKNFGGDMKSQLQVKYYDVRYLFIDPELTYDIEENEDILSFIKSFAQENKKKLITNNRVLKDVDYYIVEESDESTDS